MHITYEWWHKPQGLSKNLPVLLLLFFCWIKKLGEIQCVYHADIVLAPSANMWFCSIGNMCVNTWLCVCASKSPQVCFFLYRFLNNGISEFKRAVTVRVSFHTQAADCNHLHTLFTELRYMSVNSGLCCAAAPFSHFPDSPVLPWWGGCYDI